MTRRPNLFIVGAPKSGTTSMYDYLAGHPDVYMSPIKEPGYFAADLQAGFKRRMNWPQDEEAYLALFADAGDEQYLGEASTRYLASHLAPKVVKEFAPDARIVAMFRNPVDLVYALHNERVSHGAEDVTDFEQALALDDERRAGRQLPRGSNALGSVYRDNGLLGAQLARWLEHFDRERVHAIVFDDLARDTPGVFRRLLEFLEIDPAYQPAEFAVVNRSHRSRGGLVKLVMESRVTRFARQRVLPALMGETRAAQLARRVRHSRLNRRPNPRPPMSAQVRSELEQFFAPDIALLGRLIGRDLSGEWLGRPATSADAE